MKGKRISRRHVLWRGRIPGNEYRRGAQAQARCRQSRHVQGLAEMAGGIRTIGVLMENGGPNREIQQSSARQQRHRAASKHSPRVGPPHTHEWTPQLSTVRRKRNRFVCNRYCHRLAALISNRPLRYRSVPRRQPAEENLCPCSGPEHETGCGPRPAPP